MGADVAVLDRNPEALRRVDAVLGNRVGVSLPAPSSCMTTVRQKAYMLSRMKFWSKGYLFRRCLIQAASCTERKAERVAAFSADRRKMAGTKSVW
jgi:hypothetical protein